MKKHKEFKLPKISADAVAANLKRSLGLPEARRVAKNLLDGVGFHPKTNNPLVSVEDVNSSIFTRRDIVKNAHTWRQIHAILMNQKGFTVIELLCLVAFLGVLIVGVVEVGVIVHFLRKFW